MVRSSKSLLLLVLTLATACSVAAAADRSRLSEGEVFVSTIDVDGANLPKVRVEAVVDAPPDAVWQVVSSCEGSQHTMPNVQKSYVVKRISESRFVCSEKIHLPFPLRDVLSVTEWVLEPGPDVWRRSWTLVEGDFDYATGSWTLRPFDREGTRTHVVYENHFSPHLSVPDWVTRIFLKRSMPDLIEHVRAASTARAER